MRETSARSAVVTFSAVLLGVAAFLTTQGVALAADGAYFLLRIIDDRSTYGQAARSLVVMVRQAPVLVGLWAGATDVHQLTLLLGVGQLVIPALAWVVALVLVRGSAIACCAVMLTAAISWGCTALFNVGELSLAVPLAMIVSGLLWCPTPWRLRESVLAIGAAVVLTRSHEAILLMAGILAAWAAVRAYRSRSTPERWACAACSLLGAFTVVSAIREIVRRQEDPSAGNLWHSILRLLPLEVYTLLAVAACLLALVFFESSRWARLSLVLSGTVAGLASVYGLFATNGDSYSARGGAMLVALLCQVFLLVLWHRSSRGLVTGTGRASAAGVWLCVGVACVPLLAAAMRADRWGDSLSSLRVAVVSHRGLVPADELLAGDRFALWNGTAPTLSLLVRRQPDDAVLLDAPGVWQPFAPERARDQLDDRYTWRSG